MQAVEMARNENQPQMSGGLFTGVPFASGDAPTIPDVWLLFFQPLKTRTGRVLWHLHAQEHK
jgi:hypothetical protein